MSRHLVGAFPLPAPGLAPVSTHKNAKGRSRTGLGRDARKRHFTLSLSRFFSSVASPIPFTSSNSSTVAKSPCSSRYSTIA